MSKTKTKSKPKAKRRPKVTTAPFSYSDAGTPKGYKCGECGATGVKLWREWNTFLDYQTLRCVKCACGGKKQDIITKEVHDVTAMDCQVQHPKAGTLAAAIPTEEGDTYWGYTSVPTLGCIWWYNLPGPRWTAVEIKNYIEQAKSNLQLWKDCLAKPDVKSDPVRTDYYKKMKADCELGIRTAKKILAEL